MHFYSLRSSKLFTLRGENDSKGFSLLEMAAVMLIMGILITPAVQMYHQHRVDKDWDEVATDTTRITNALGGYRAIYGRYPCPAATNAAPNSTTYGFEFPDCAALAPPPGSCAGGICTYTNTVSGRDVVVGSLPYKTLNLHEAYSFDSYKNRYTYAITLDLTSNVTFNMSSGGISVLDSLDTSKSLISPAGSAHFVVLSHGKNGAGSVARSGQPGGNVCGNGAAAEQENCDGDADFAGGSYNSSTFDDRVTYFTSVEPSEWQYSADATFENAIHLKNTGGFAIGKSLLDDLSTASELTIVDTTGGTGSIYAMQNFESEQLCKEGSIASGDCFEPEIIGGTLVANGAGTRMKVGTTGGLSCYDDSSGPVKDYYMAGIANSNLLCTDEVFMLCPSGRFVQSVNASGDVKCDVLPGAWCPDQVVQATCPDNSGDTDYTISTVMSGGYGMVYSGECRKFATNYDWAYFDTQISAMSAEHEVNQLINNINNEARVIDDCDTPFTGKNTLVRDGFRCYDGTWAPYRTHERIYTWNTNFSWPSYGNNSSSWRAETDQNHHADPHNTKHRHDCWCREDYRYRTTGCQPFHLGVAIAIDKHTCPQTTHDWTQNIYVSDQMCECVPSVQPVWQRCAYYYNELAGTSYAWNTLSGSVWKYYDITCDVDGNPVQSPTPSNIIASCTCNPSTTVDRRSCSGTFPGTTNSWSWAGGSETNVREMDFLERLCPASSVSDTFGNTIPHPREAQITTPYAGSIPACACDSDLSRERRLDCPPGLQGAGMYYDQEWDCTLNAGAGGWEDQSLWDLTDDKCHACKWKAPTGSPSIEKLPYGEEVNTTCTCGTSATSFCHTVVGADENKVWSSCPCIVQN